MPLKPSGSFAAEAVALGLLAGLALLLPGNYGLELAGLMLLGYAALNPAAFVGLFNWLGQLGEKVQ